VTVGQKHGQTAFGRCQSEQNPELVSFVSPLVLDHRRTRWRVRDASRPDRIRARETPATEAENDYGEKLLVHLVHLVHQPVPVPRPPGDVCLGDEPLKTG
jgi:hypothetical protein